jgi:hypothetical protein
MWSTSVCGHLMKVVNLTGFTVYINSDCIFSVLLLITVSYVLLCLLPFACVFVLSVADNALFHIQLSTNRHWIWETYVCNVMIWKERSAGFNPLNVFMNAILIS